MVTVELRLWRIGLAELQILVLADLHPRHHAVAVLEFSGDSRDLGIEAANAFGGPDGYVELDIGNAEGDAAEALCVRLIAAHAIAPWTDRLDIVVVLAVGEGGAL